MTWKEIKTAVEDTGPSLLTATAVILSLLATGFTCITNAQAPKDSTSTLKLNVPKDQGPAAPKPEAVDKEKSTELLLLERIEKLERGLSNAAEREKQLLERIDKLEQKQPAVASTNDSESGLPVTTLPAKEEPVRAQEAGISNEDRSLLDSLQETTFNVIIDGYYGYNFNRPVGGINLLRAYDVQSNSFSLNQAALVIENAPNLEKGKRYGFRLDLQYGQATETVQGNAANEPRPQVYRNLWQAYGSYVVDVGKGLTVDFGKYAGSLGYETNYTKDNFNYSRAYFFNFLPFYHFGFRAKYPINDKVAVMYHLVNGTQQSEDFNGFKSQHIAVVLTPTKRVSGQINYYFGQEQRDRNPALNPTFAVLPTQPGLSTDVIRPVPSGFLHIFDTYYTFNVTDKLTLAVEGDYVIGRTFRDSPPATVWGGAGYVRYQWTPKFALAGRVEYLGERVSPTTALFGGLTQALKETTFTAEYKFADGFLGRAEYRRDFSNQPFFLTEQPGILKKEQNTATFGLVWWFGRKAGTW
jgi:Putative beta-barrel porin-2, OmpL-like. bbp2